MQIATTIKVADDAAVTTSDDDDISSRDYSSSPQVTMTKSRHGLVCY